MRASVHHATEALDLLAIDLAPLSALPRKLKVAPNQHNNWSNTQALMGVPVKSKAVKRKDRDPYGGNEHSGKKAKSDARDGPSSNGPLESQQVPMASASPPSTEGGASYYRLHASMPMVIETSSSTPLLPLISNKRPTASFDPNTFDLSDEMALSELNHTQLRALCAKYDVDTTRASVGMDTNLREYHLNSQRPVPPAPALLPHPGAYPSYYPYPSYPYYYSYAPVNPQNSHTD
ncbi:hypothetical protein FB451DRAFT_1435306 [Mycena latifolia]|nr:hypothetical protein FB451DRAFT_1435306 [Mycena latifolia]